MEFVFSHRSRTPCADNRLVKRRSEKRTASGSIVPTPDELRRAAEDVIRPDLAQGSISVLEMTDDQMERAAAPRVPFGFRRTEP